jgi:hypothetical protein
VARLIEDFVETPLVHAPAPFSDHDRGDGVPHSVRDGHPFSHEPVDAKYERNARDRNRSRGGKRPRQHDQRGARDASRPFRREQQDREEDQLLRQSQGRVGGLCDEYGRD